MKTFKVWCPDEGDEECDAVEVNANRPHQAAEERAAAMHDGEGCIDFLVLDGDTLYEVSVDCEMEWHFTGIVMRKGKREEAADV